MVNGHMPEAIALLWLMVFFKALEVTSHMQHVTCLP